MTRVIFYEKPGCAANARQKSLLRRAGHEVVARDLLAWSWTADELYAFLGHLPIPHWFNRNAPRVRSGEVVPESLQVSKALALMLADPLLIRRPLMQVDNGRCAGFDTAFVERWIGLPPAPPANLEVCKRREHKLPCCGPGAAV